MKSNMGDLKAAKSLTIPLSLGGNSLRLLTLFVGSLGSWGKNSLAVVIGSLTLRKDPVNLVNFRSFLGYLSWFYRSRKQGATVEETSGLESLSMCWRLGMELRAMHVLGKNSMLSHTLAPHWGTLGKCSGRQASPSEEPKVSQNSSTTISDGEPVMCMCLGWGGGISGSYHNNRKT